MKESKLYRFSRPLIKGFTQFFWHPKYLGLENLDNKEGFICAGTHTHIFDCLLLMASTKRSIHFLAKAELWQGFKKIIFAHMGLIPVKRNGQDHEAIVTAEKYLNNEEIIGIFPEGTCEKGKGLLPFKMGAVKIAKDTNKKIVPFAIVGKYKIFKSNLTIIFGKPYQVKDEDLAYENAKLREKVQELIKKGEEYGQNK